MTETLKIESMAYQGAGVTHTAQGKTVFVEGAVVGDVVIPLTCRSASHYDTCLSFELVEPSSKRVESPCSNGEVCNGCPWHMLEYDEQLFWKRQFVVDALKRIGGISNSEELVRQCVPSPLQWHYRNKIELGAFRHQGKIALGFRKKASREYIRVDECSLLPKTLEKLPRNLAGALSYSLRETQEDLVRIAIRSSLNTGATELGLFMVPSGVNRSLLAKTLNQNVELSSLVRVIIDGKIDERRVKQVEVLSGAGYWQEELAGNEYRISAPSFFQINSSIAQDMIIKLGEILDELGLDASTPVADLYCGAGTFTLPLAERFDRVVAIESYGSSIRDLRRNLERRQLHAEIIGGDVARELRQVDPVEVAIIDPPRSGLKPEAVESLLQCEIPQLIYVSCNPATMARDIGLLSQGGYHLQDVTPFDQFPQSYHIEMMAVLSINTHSMV